VLPEVTSLLFVYVCDTDITSGFASESTSKLDSLDSRIRIRIRASRTEWTDSLNLKNLNLNPDTDSSNEEVGQFLLRAELCRLLIRLSSCSLYYIPPAIPHSALQSS